MVMMMKFSSRMRVFATAAAAAVTLEIMYPPLAASDSLSLIVAESRKEPGRRPSWKSRRRSRGRGASSGALWGPL